MKKTALALVAVLVGGTAHAEGLPLSIFGIGQKTCGSFIAAVGNTLPGNAQEIDTRNGEFFSEIVSYQSWLMGFITGVNAESLQTQGQQISNVDLAAVDLWMRNWCNSHPTRIVFEGAMAFRKEMRK